MRHCAWLAYVLVCGCSAGSRGADPDLIPPTSGAAAEAANELRQLQDRWRRALSARDTAFFRSVLADEFLLTGNARTRTKSDFLAELQGSDGTVPLARPEETNIRLFGDFAVVTGLVRYDIQGTSGPVVTRYTEVWLKRNGQWLSIHGHYNPLSVVESLERR